MRAIHKRCDGLFLRTAVLLLFLAVCAYGGAALYDRLQPVQPVSAPAEAVAALRLEGVALRTEEPLVLPGSAALAVEDGDRVPAGGLLGRLADGSSVRAEAPALFFSELDGLEHLRAPAPETLGVAELRELLSAAPQLPEGSRGRLVSDSVWYFAALVPADPALPQSGACRLRFSGKTEWLSARLLAVSVEEEGQRALLFRLSRGGEYLSLRRSAAELVFPA